MILDPKVASKLIKPKHVFEVKEEFHKFYLEMLLLWKILSYFKSLSLMKMWICVFAGEQRNSFWAEVPPCDLQKRSEKYAVHSNMTDIFIFLIILCLHVLLSIIYYLPVNKVVCMVGSYGPRAEEQEFLCPADETLKGVLSRGQYLVKSCFTDDDKNIHLAWEWNINISKDWNWELSHPCFRFSPPRIWTQLEGFKIQPAVWVVCYQRADLGGDVGRRSCTTAPKVLFHLNLNSGLWDAYLLLEVTSAFIL